jgi:polyhydroxyalkanoate synthesis regulator phasin
MFEQIKIAKELLKNINPSDLPKLMEQASQSQKAIEEMIRKIVRQELEKLNLPTRQEIEELKANLKK